MATGLQNQHKNERFDTEAVYPMVLTVHQDDLSATDQVYVVSPVKGNIEEVYSAVNTALTVAKSTLTVKAPDGTVGAFEIATLAPVGTVDQLSAQATLANTEVEKGEVIEIENNDAPGAGAATFTIIIGP